jgi:hypothetical protein
MFLFLVSKAKSMGNLCNNGEAPQIGVCALPILSFPFCCTNTIGSTIRTSPIGTVQRIKKKYATFSHLRSECALLHP